MGQGFKLVVHKQPAVAAVVVERGQHPLDGDVGEPDPEVLARHRFDGVGLIEHHDVVGRKQARSTATQGEVGEEEGVVDDHDMRARQPPAGRHVVALLVVRAGPAHAVGRVALHLIPHARQRHHREVGARPVEGGLRPASDPLQLRHLGIVSKQASGTLLGHLQPPQADIVAPAFGEHRGKLPWHHRSHQGHILANKLLLQGNRVGRDHHPPRPGPGRWLGERIVVVSRRQLRGVGLLIGGHGQHRRHEVGQALPHPRPCLTEQMPPLANRRLHRPGHRQLLRPRLPAGQTRGKPAIGSENVVGGEHERPEAAAGTGRFSPGSPCRASPRRHFERQSPGNMRDFHLFSAPWGHYKLGNCGGNLSISRE